MQQSRVYVGMILILIFGEVLGLYGYVSEPGYFFQITFTNMVSLIVGLILNSKS